jgi:hypothetical protein
MKQITLELAVEEINLILEGLGNLPFIRVHGLISKIHQQASSQVHIEETVKNNDAVTLESGE